ncbi:MAG: hypothetical protein CVV23_08815 [Ignavibacteriae bacterium HGW-Ignavibacteriae-2]|jgi:hypothetical protein|nr:hypothetical protein [Bacteroidota bacterium]PKL88720.1 MAG: hypothetical protein CVV23_08815 [Ignavibacteriae bacterium HGW-Ignavibacteriae-2]
MQKYFFRIGLGAVVGAILGYSYYYFIGCNGSCAIAGNPYISTVYGLLAGVAIVFPSKIKDKKDEKAEG